MRRLATHIIFALLAIVAMTSCSHNDGDIGLWFGLWHLDSIEIDGEPDSIYDGKYYFLFQNKVFIIRWVDEQRHEYIESYAQWQECDNGKTMTINFVDNRYSPYFGGGRPNNYLSTVTTFTVDTLTSTNMVLHHTRDDGAIITYRLTNWK